MSLTLNLKGGLNDNSLPSVHLLSPPQGDFYQVIPLPNGVAHDNVTVRLVSSGAALTQGTDWDYLHKSDRADKLFGISAYGSIYIINKTLVEEVRITPDYLGGSFETHDASLIPNVVAYDNVANLYWDTSLSEIEDTIDPTLPGGESSTTLLDIIHLLGEFQRIASGGVNTSEVLTELDKLVNILQTDTADIPGTDLDDVVDIINLVFSELNEEVSKGYHTDALVSDDLSLPVEFARSDALFVSDLDNHEDGYMVLPTPDISRPNESCVVDITTQISAVWDGSSEATVQTLSKNTVLTPNGDYSGWVVSEALMWIPKSDKLLRRVVQAGTLSYYDSTTQTTKSTALSYGDVVIVGPKAEYFELLTSPTEPLRQNPLVDPALVTVKKDVSGALGEIASKTESLRREHQFLGFLNTATNLTNVVGEDAWWYITVPIQITASLQPDGNVQTLSLSSNQLLIRESNLYRVADRSDPVYKIPFLIPSLAGTDKTILGELKRISQKIFNKRSKVGQVTYAVLGTILPEAYQDSNEQSVDDSVGLSQLLTAQFGSTTLPSLPNNRVKPILDTLNVVAGYPSEDVSILNLGYSTNLDKLVLRVEIANVGHTLAVCDRNGESFVELSSVSNMDDVNISDFRVVGNDLFYSTLQDIVVVDLSTEVSTTYGFGGSLSTNIDSLIPIDETTSQYFIQTSDGDVVLQPQNEVVLDAADSGMIVNHVLGEVYCVKGGSIYRLPFPTTPTDSVTASLITTKTNNTLSGVGAVDEVKGGLFMVNGEDPETAPFGLSYLEPASGVLSVFKQPLSATNPVWVSLDETLYFIQNGVVGRLKLAPKVHAYLRG